MGGNCPVGLSRDPSVAKYALHFTLLNTLQTKLMQQKQTFISNMKILQYKINTAKKNNKKLHFVVFCYKFNAENRDKAQFYSPGAHMGCVGKIIEASAPTIRLDATPSGPSMPPHPSSPQFYAGYPSCRNPPNLSCLGTGTKYAALHT